MKLCPIPKRTCQSFFSQTSCGHSLRFGKAHEHRNKLFERFFMSKRLFFGILHFYEIFLQTQSILTKKLEWGHRKLHVAPSNVTISKWVAKFRGRKMFERKKNSGSPRLSGQRRSRLECPSQSRKKSLKHRAQSLGLNKSSPSVIIRKDLHLRP